MSTVKEILRLAGQKLKESGVDTPALDAGVLLSHVTGCSRAELYRDWECELPAQEEARFFQLLTRREAGEPVAYLTGRKEFMGLQFVVDKSVLIPRPETELLVETAMSLTEKGIIVDVGTGSGAIAISLAVFLPRAAVYATELSSAAIEVARLNAARHDVGQRVFFFLGDLLRPLAGLALSGRVDLIAANLPYIAADELVALPRQVRLYEPAAALDGGADGLDLYRRLLPAAADLLKPGGRLLMEIGCGQREAMADLLRRAGWKVEFLQDLAGLDRLAVAAR